MKISYGKNVYGKEEINAVLNKLNKTTHMGDAVTSFENKIAKLFSKKYGLMVNSGSSALILATNVLNFKKGDEIIISELEHHSNIVPWQMCCEISGSTLKVIPLLDNGSLDMENFNNLLSEKINSITWKEASKLPLCLLSKFMKEREKQKG